MNFIAIDRDWTFSYVNLNEKYPYRIAIGNISYPYLNSVGEQFRERCIEAMKDQRAMRVEIYCALDGAVWEYHIYPGPAGLSIYFKDITREENAERNLSKKQHTGSKEQRAAQEEMLLREIELHRSNNLSKLAIPTVEGFDFVAIQEILYCKASGNYTEIFTTDGARHLSSRQLKDYELLLQNYNFFRIHHSCIIQLDYIKTYTRGEGGYVVMVDNTALDVSRRKKSAFLERLGYRASDAFTKVV
ncbi:MAG TPA: LytTR family DNA-binding domain-containing protein [Ohtaekwangia sp.]|uniref:LytR/AlgR family response regulator transcription factor n=1 Tax=Ohtaekwangia sp. TaxID=2066019 RepID=UPI002F9318C1